MPKRSALRASGRRPYTKGVRTINEERFSKLSRAIVRALVTQGNVKLHLPESEVVERLTRMFVENLAEEHQIEEEAERMLAKLGRQVQGMDQRKLINGFKEHIAKERGYSL